MPETLRDHVLQRHKQLKDVYRPWEPHHRKLAENILPRRARFSTSELNRGDRINDSIINNTPLIAARIMSSGLMAAITSPQREWFRLTTPDPEMAEWGPARGYLHACETRIRWAFAISPFYRLLADTVYPDIGIFGFTGNVMEEDPDPRRILRFTSYAIGEFVLATNARDEVDTESREFPMTVRQLAQEFGLEKLPTHVRDQYQKGNYDDAFDVIHMIEPNDRLERGAGGPPGMAWRSLWLLTTDDRKGDDAFLRIGGYDSFPGLCPRWAVQGNDVYGRSPGMEILGDCGSLQFEERRLAGIIDKTVNPPMIAPEELRGQFKTLRPGDTTYIPRTAQGLKFEPAMKLDFGAISAVAEDIARIEDRIERGMYADLFLRLVQDQRQQRATATEIEELKNETALQLGPVLERLNSELLKPAIDRAYAILDRRGLLPDPPEELMGIDLEPQFISVMHQAQKTVGLTGIRVFLSEMMPLAQLRPDAVDKLNADEIADELAQVTGIKPDMLLTDEEVEKARSERAKRQAAMDEGNAMLAATQGTKNLASSPAPAPSNSLGALLQSIGGPLATAASPAQTGGLPS